MRIMIFDDEMDVLNLYSLILKKKGHEVHAEQNCMHILDKISEIKPDVILMDNEMPVLSGLDATKLLKGTNDYAHIPIISISANSEGKKLAEEAHADMFLPKPIGISELEKAITHVTHRRAA